MAGQYDIGDGVKLSADFADIGGTPTDPSTITVRYKDPGGTVTSKVYDTDAEVKKGTTGNYYIEITVDKSGNWRYRWEGTGTVQAADEAEFHVEHSEFP